MIRGFVAEGGLDDCAVSLMVCGLLCDVAIDPLMRERGNAFGSRSGVRQAAWDKGKITRSWDARKLRLPSGLRVRRGLHQPTQLLLPAPFTWIHCRHLFASMSVTPLFYWVIKATRATSNPVNLLCCIPTIFPPRTRNPDADYITSIATCGIPNHSTPYVVG